MRKTFIFIALVSVFPLAQPVAAQEEPGRIDVVYSVTPKAGMEKQFEEAAKRHMAWHRQQNDPRTWYAFFVVMGDGIGEYHYVLPNQRWEDFDKHAELEQADMADYFANVAQYLESLTANMNVRLNELSRIPATEGPKPLAWVTYVHVNPGKGSQYRLYRQKLRAAREKINWKRRSFVVQVINGSEVPAFAIVTPVEKWAEFGPGRRRQTLTEVYGSEEAEQLLDLRDQAIHCRKSFISSYRPDLSYIPAGQ